MAKGENLNHSFTSQQFIEMCGRSEFQNTNFSAIQGNILARLDQLEKLGGLQNCLVHLDFFDGNLTFREQNGKHPEGFYFFDSGSSVCTHPTFDMLWCNEEEILLYCITTFSKLLKSVYYSTTLVLR